jgi:membrane-bound lytic murein transglycosylase A
VAVRTRYTSQHLAAALGLLAAAMTPAGAQDASPATTPIKFPNAQIEPLTWSAIEGWAGDDHAIAFSAFLKSCRAILNGSKAMRAAKPVYGALYEICQRADAACANGPLDAASARTFFEQNFRPVRISAPGENAGFLTGYYEPVVEGARYPSYDYSVPLYRKPSNLVVAGARKLAASFPNAGKIGRKFGRRKMLPYYDRTAIEEGAIAGRGLEICWLKDPIDAFFAQIQGSARIKLDTGQTMRVNYEAHNGLPYTAVGKFLIDRGIVTKEQMSMDRIRHWMAANPEEGKELRRKNRSFVFFRETGLSDDDEPVGAQGIPLTTGRSIAVDKSIHVYGTPFWIDADLPIENEKPETKFRRLMIAQDTGSAILGVARADIYFGSGESIGSIAGRIKQPGKFVMLVPGTLDPVATAQIPLPPPRPDEKAKADEKRYADDVAEVVLPKIMQPLSQPAEIADVPLPKPRPKTAPERT